jgi:drug/metabolite transporter (DMT)-like permease
LLVFVLVFAILERAEILGQNKRAANVIVAMVIGFIFVGVPYVVGVTLKIIPVIGLILVILLCFLLLFGFIHIDIAKSKKLQMTLGIILGIALIGTILWAFGIFDKISINPSSPVFGYVIFFLIFGGAIALVVGTAPKHTTSST